MLVYRIVCVNKNPLHFHNVDLVLFYNCLYFISVFFSTNVTSRRDPSNLLPLSAVDNDDDDVDIIYNKHDDGMYQYQCFVTGSDFFS